jgi:hypothetical protein
MLFVNLFGRQSRFASHKIAVIQICEERCISERPVNVYLYIIIIAHLCPAFFKKKFYLPKKPPQNLPYRQSWGKKGLFYEITGGLKPKSSSLPI